MRETNKLKSEHCLFLTKEFEVCELENGSKHMENIFAFTIFYEYIRISILILQLMENNVGKYTQK